MQVVQDRYAPGVQECFRRFDEDNSGSLGSSELRGALKSLGLAVTSTQAAALVGRYDDDGSSELSVDEFNALVVSILQLQEQESAAAVTLQARRRGMSARRLSSELGARALDGALAAPHFTNLAPTDDGSLAYSELKASNLRLTDLAADLSAFAQLATLDVSHNMLRNLNGLGALPVLVTLNAAGNSLRRLLDFEPPASGSRLRVADLRDNCISNQASADSFSHPQLETLLLDGNRMASLECLRSLRCLRRLTVSRNALRDTAGLDGLSSLEHLDLARNQLDSAEALPSLVGLRTLLPRPQPPHRAAAPLAARWPHRRRPRIQPLRRPPRDHATARGAADAARARIRRQPDRGQERSAPRIAVAPPRPRRNRRRAGGADREDLGRQLPRRRRPPPRRHP